MCAFVSAFAYKPKKLKESKGGDGGGGAPGKMKLEFASEPSYTPNLACTTPKRVAQKSTKQCDRAQTNPFYPPTIGWRPGRT
jgi:hypothetical protein